ncbi:MAG: hypothetical protein KBG28_27730 [Kofleriaceae bacterium]|jgi:hypothetical protein|nr:hypothetical protein [Kofleriaceae bacterium]MBP6840069.1 hypothetical protein [Kofleriaceae bacterium]MBP9207786.1 hypothetical protein [Kofleriaceae bacterium]
MPSPWVIAMVVALGLGGCDRTPPPSASPPGAGATRTEPIAPAPAAPAAASAASTEVLPLPHRALTPAEITLLRPLFADGITYDRVRVVHNTFPFQPAGTYMTPRGHVFAPGDLYEADFAGAGVSLGRTAVFVHELTHVWQYESGMDLIAQGAIELVKNAGDYEKAYPYQLSAGRDLLDYGMEQQASIVEDFFRLAGHGLLPLRATNRGASVTELTGLYDQVLSRLRQNPRYARAMSARDVASRHAEAAAQASPGPAACAESEAEHGAAHVCSWRFEPR